MKLLIFFTFVHTNSRESSLEKNHADEMRRCQPLVQTCDGELAYEKETLLNNDDTDCLDQNLSFQIDNPAEFTGSNFEVQYLWFTASV